MNTFSPDSRLVGRKRQRGGAAVELALILPFLILFMTFPIFYARCFWHYTVAQKAAQDAARFLSTVSRPEMMSTSLGSAAAATAVEIAKREMAGLRPGGPILSPEAYCDNNRCGTTPGAVPEYVRVKINFSMFDTAMGVVDVGRYGVLITAEARVPYVGN